VPYQSFATADHEIMVAVGNDDQFRRLCDLLGLAEVAADPRFGSNDLRVRHRQLLLPALARVFASAPRHEWLARLIEAGIPAAPVNSLPEALADPPVVARGLVAPGPHPLAGELPMVMSPFGAAARRRSGPPPLLGQHNREVLSSELGLSPAELDELERAGVLRTTRVDQ
jgi:crotonobetainyl-CoA:carnitine CoA-transferase CaiB-like acyl-CoA transferase